MKDTFAKFIEQSAIRFKHAKGMLNVWGNEIHPFHEIFLFLGGDAEFVSEEINLKLNPETMIIIPKEKYHQFIVHGAEEEYQRFVINFPNNEKMSNLLQFVMKRVCVIEQPSPAIRLLFERLKASFTEPLHANEKGLLLSAIHTQLLLEIKLQLIHGTFSYKNHKDPLTIQALQYINNHFSQKIIITDIAAMLNVSVSTLTHIFKKDMHISFYHYILEKRLVEANQKISGGMRPTDAAYLCGFYDYSAFYRAYKKMFGKNPSDKTLKRIMEQ